MNDKRRTVLFVMPRFPFPALSGRKTSLYHYCRILSQKLGFRLVVAAFEEDGDVLEGVPDFIDRLIILPTVKNIEKAINIVKDSIILRRRPMQVSLYWSKEAKKIIDKMVQEEHPDFVIGDMVRSTEYIKDLDVKKIADLDDRISLRYQRQLEIDIKGINPYGAYINSIPEFMRRTLLWKPIKTAIVKNEILLLKKYEVEISKQCDNTIFVAENEAAQMNIELGEPKAMAVPIGVDTEFFSYRDVHKENYIGFLGALNVAHNENAVKHFVQNIFPYIQDKIHDAKFLIIGGGASENLMSLKCNEIIFTGRVDDVREYLSICKVFACPMTFGSGIKTKNLEAMAMGIPVVTTPIGAENIDAQDGKEWIIADTAENFAKEICSLLENEQRRKKIGLNGRQYIEKKWTWETAQSAFESLLI